jgi:hypothetical protein
VGKNSFLISSVSAWRPDGGSLPATSLTAPGYRPPAPSRLVTAQAVMAEASGDLHRAAQAYGEAATRWAK